MKENKHVYKKEGKTYEMIIEKQKKSKGYLVLEDGTKLEANGESAVTPTIIHFFVIEDDEKKNITETIEKDLRNEIVNDFWKELMK